MKIGDCMKRTVVSIPATATVGEAAALIVARHIGLLPVVDAQGRVLGVLGVRDLLTLELPAFVNLVDDVDFVHDFGAVETTRPAPEMLTQPVTSLMRPATAVPAGAGARTPSLARGRARLAAEFLGRRAVKDYDGGENME